MTELSLAITDLPEGWINASVGDAVLVRDNLYFQFDIENLTPVVADHNKFKYTKPNGYDPLVKFLEDKHHAPVIVTNGAKQAIGALIYALNNQGRDKVFMRRPWWSLFPTLIDLHGSMGVSNIHKKEDTAFLYTYPNNPDGSGGEAFEYFLNYAQEHNIPLIHDAVYYSNIYMDSKIDEYKAGIEVYSMSKYLGLSQLRVGYIVFNDTNLYDSVIKYIETTTVGASVLSQIFAFNILETLKQNPNLTRGFERNCYDRIMVNRNLCKNISSDILQPDPDSKNGMFLWTKCHNTNAFNKSKITVADGKDFGSPGYIRMNLALPETTIKEIVERLNNG